MQNIKQDIKDKLSSVLRAKFSSYAPETSYMPFHTRLLGKDKMALYSFIQSLNTNFGTSIFEPVALELAKNNFNIAKKQVEVGTKISAKAQMAIENIMSHLESGENKPNRDLEKERILKVAKSGNFVNIKPTKADLFLQKDSQIYLIDIKTAKPNKGGFRDMKRTLLTWTACCELEYSDIHTLIAIPYNPYEPKPYERWSAVGMLDLAQELRVAGEFWDFLGGSGSYDMLLEAFEEVGCEMREEIDEYFRNFRYLR